MILVEEKVEKEVGEYKMSNVSMKHKEETTIVTFKNTHPSIVNSFRRIILDEVPTFAIEDVEIVKNESPLYDETIAHRLGLLPLTTDLKTYNFKDKCKCKGVGCALCEVKMSLKAKGEGYVYSKAIKSNDPKICVVDKEIPITKLFGEKEIEANLTAIIGKGREHAKWAPAHTYLNDTGKAIDLYIESFGQLNSKEIFNKSVEIVVEKIDELEAQL